MLDYININFKDRGASRKVDGLRSECKGSGTWGSGGAAPGKKFRINLIGLLESTLIIVT